MAHRRQHQMAMPTGPLVVLSPNFVAPYETTFFLREKVSTCLARYALGHSWPCLQSQLRQGADTGTAGCLLYSCEASCFRIFCLVQVFSIRDSFDVRDASGQTAFQLRGALVSMREVNCPGCH